MGGVFGVQESAGKKDFGGEERRRKSDERRGRNE